MCRVQIAVLASGLTVSQLVKTAWASASTYRKSDKRGGANGARIALARRRWAVNEPEDWQKCWQSSTNCVRNEPCRCNRAGRVTAVEKAAHDAGFNVSVPFSGGRGDATQDWTDVDSFVWREPQADGSATISRRVNGEDRRVAARQGTLLGSPDLK